MSSQMTRTQLEDRVDELEEEVAQLREMVQKNEQKPSRTTMNHILSQLMNVDLDNYDADLGQLIGHSQEFGNQIQQFNQRLSRVEEIAEEEETLSNDPAVSNWKAIVKTARNLASDREHALPNNRVKLHKKQVKSAVGCSERHALNLIEEFGEDKRGAAWQEYKRHTTSRKTESQDIQKKALIVDLSVWGDGDA